MEVPVELNMKQRLATRLGIISFSLFAFNFALGSLKATMAVSTLLMLMILNPTLVYGTVVTLKRDIIASIRFVALNMFMLRMEHKQWSIARIVHERAKAQPDHPCFIMIDGQTMSYADVAAYANKVAAYFKGQALRRGDCVALLLDTRPEYACIWLGLSQIGVTTALINTNLRRESLLHSIRVANARAIIVGTELAAALNDVTGNAELDALPIYQFSDETQRASDDYALMRGAVELSPELARQQVTDDVNAELRLCKPKDRLLYVYTSGTTGMPKAAVITNMRYLFMASGTSYMLDIKRSDIIYNPLPLYHTAGGIVCVGQAFINGSTVVLRKKFSASNFWRDCIKHDCTVAQYIGELCRYLLATPHKPEDTQHRLRMMYGNGLRPQIWPQFESRFNIPQIGEVYGATEGNSNLANITGHVGAIGFVPVLGRRLYPAQLIRCDEETGEPLRDGRGRCIRCRAGETGLLVGKVNPRRAITAFHGYADKASSDKKLLHDVFGKGDVFFNSGDMMVSDILGYFYFKDRTGDTFRWRGENVATQEVEAIITNVVGLSDCVVYGVDIPHVEGKAGMAAIMDPTHKVDIDYLSVGIRGSLPPYARPLFIRLMKEIPRTATFKFQKRDLMREGFDIDKLQEPIYYLNKDGVYRQLTRTQFDDLKNGTAGL